MNKFADKKRVKPMEAVVLLNDNYENKGLKKGYIGVVVADSATPDDTILVDFFNPLTGEDIAVVAEIKKEDCKIITESKSDKLAVKEFKDSFKNM